MLWSAVWNMIKKYSLRVWNWIEYKMSSKIKYNLKSPREMGLRECVTRMHKTTRILLRWKHPPTCCPNINKQHGSREKKSLCLAESVSIGSKRDTTKTKMMNKIIDIFSIFFSLYHIGMSSLHEKENQRNGAEKKKILSQTAWIWPQYLFVHSFILLSDICTMCRSDDLKMHCSARKIKCWIVCFFRLLKINDRYKNGKTLVSFPTNKVNIDTSIGRFGKQLFWSNTRKIKWKRS